MAAGVLPQVGIETAEFLPYPDETTGVANDGFYLSPRFYHTGIFHCLVHVLCGEESNLFVVETSKAGTENLALAQHQNPTESGGHGFEHQIFKEHPVVMAGNAPLCVVILFQKSAVAAPFTLFHRYQLQGL